MSEAHRCFEYLKESSPKWLVDLSELEKHVGEKQKEVAKSESGSDDAVVLPLRNASVASVKDQPIPSGPQALLEDSPRSSDSPEDSAHPSASRRRNVLTKRSKKPGSIASSVASGAPKFRTRNMIIVYYDAEIQRTFEKLVREVGNGRHLIRKARLAAQAEAFSGQLDDDELYGMADDVVAPDMRVMTFRRAGASSSQTKLADGEGSPTLSAFDKADKGLETAQSLCEKAAHQYLRDGDCRMETQSAKEAFQEVLKTSEEELARLNLKEQAMHKGTSGSEPKTSSSSSTDQNIRGGHGSRSKPTRSGLANIEVDDDEELIPAKLPTLRMTSRMGPRRGPT